LTGVRVDRFLFILLYHGLGGLGRGEVHLGEWLAALGLPGF
jgi:hypothetical protein